MSSIWKILDIVSSYILSVSFYLSLPSGSPLIHILALYIVSYGAVAPDYSNCNTAHFQRHQSGRTRVGQANMLCSSLLELRSTCFLERMLLRFLPVFNYFLEKFLTVSAGPIAFMDKRVFGGSHFTIPVDMISPCGSVFSRGPLFQVVRSGVCSSKMDSSLPGTAWGVPEPSSCPHWSCHEPVPRAPAAKGIWCHSALNRMKISQYQVKAANFIRRSIISSSTPYC